VRKLCPHCTTWGEPAPDQKRMLPQLPDRVPQAVGCPQCGNSGYKGRLAVFEMLTLTPAVRDCILSGVSEGELRRSVDLEPLLFDGFAKMQQGLTSAEEVIRVLLSDVKF